jgi:hypothetical protein
MEASIMRLLKRFEHTFSCLCWKNFIFKIWISVDVIFGPLHHGWTHQANNRNKAWLKVIVEAKYLETP